MKHFATHILSTMILIGGQAIKNAGYGQANSSKQTGPGKSFCQVKIIPDYHVPTVKIDSLILITDDSAMHFNDAKAILRAKVLMPLAMQKHDAALFDSVLAKDFIKRAEDEFFEREAFIQNRADAKWMISYVKYDNLVLQFFGEIAVLSYRNTVEEKDEMGLAKTWYFTWADVWVKEDGKWKSKAAYVINGNESNTDETPMQPALIKDTVTNRKLFQLNIQADYKTPAVRITNYNLITDGSGSQRKDAEAIMKVKNNWPVAMQKHDSSLFDNIFAKDFTFRAENEFFEREAYIQNRVHGEWIISYVQYENLVLQIFGKYAVLTYRNIVKEKDKMGLPNTWHIRWADIFVKENDVWKIVAAHLIGERVEKK